MKGIYIQYREDWGRLGKKKKKFTPYFPPNFSHIKIFFQFLKNLNQAKDDGTLKNP